MEVYLLVHEHKHGHDYWAFSSEDTAWDRAVGLCRGALEEWGEDEDYSGYLDEDLLEQWPDISGGEYFQIIPLLMDD